MFGYDSVDIQIWMDLKKISEIVQSIRSMRLSILKVGMTSRIENTPSQ